MSRIRPLTKGGAPESVRRRMEAADRTIFASVERFRDGDLFSPGDGAALALVEGTTQTPAGVSEAQDWSGG